MRDDYEMLVDEKGVLYFIKVNDIIGEEYMGGYIYDLPNVIPVVISYKRYRHMQIITDVYGLDMVCNLITDVNRDILYGDKWIAMPDGC